MKLCALLVLSVAAVAVTLAAAGKCSGKAKYIVRVKYEWTAARFSNRPPSPHFSPLTVFSFENRYSAFSRFGYSSDGVKTVAETGDPAPFHVELGAAKAAGQVRNMTVDPVIRGPSERVALVIDVDCRRRYVGALTMVAPTPDWVLALFRRGVVGKDGKFMNKLKGSLFVYDAGTDSGKSFMAADMPTMPRQNIAPFLGPQFNRMYLATYTMTKM